MRKGLTEIVFVIDRSGSMGGLESDVIGGFNGVIQKQRDVDGQVLVSTVLFDHETEVLHDRVDIKDINQANNILAYKEKQKLNSPVAGLTDPPPKDFA